ncbi:hypothetical protein [Pseudoxanthomonas wuyuanensis]|uniref:Lipoprotein n=1 Tax=Pseudoxanthomonas wuyuanensis TaxID=1073196 RepID=A0A286D4I1_9GAMM|nr:hypothetical protein [Pseudoxanthomonas wuyuanensis]KAF1719754.1 hypothetical protein CSC75_13755 [Pseudoxanthomonas wuyuanensis]SOD53551.1 hypothetical protein SAMN06296416_102467 [Pseudoxanthomonas wuyuanensis]
MNRHPIAIFPTLFAASLLLAACKPSSPPDAATAPPAQDAPAPADRFLAALAQHCGQAFAGRIVANEPRPTTPDAFEGRALVMHVRGCDEPTRELRVPFHVGDDRSRTWVLTRTADGLRLKHDHRHEDGSEDALTMYGGETTVAGTAQRQEFPVDAESVALFEREGLTASLTNVWAMEIEPDRRFVYELSRPGGRLFKVEFDLATQVPLPPAPWGSADGDAATPATPAGS